MRICVRPWITIGLAALALGGCGEEPMSEDEFLAYANTICANHQRGDSEREVFAMLRDVDAPDRLREDYDRALDKGSFAEAENDFRVMNLTYCADLG